MLVFRLLLVQPGLEILLIQIPVVTVPLLARIGGGAFTFDAPYVVLIAVLVLVPVLILIAVSRLKTLADRRTRAIGRPTGMARAAALAASTTALARFGNTACHRNHECQHCAAQYCCESRIHISIPLSDQAIGLHCLDKRTRPDLVDNAGEIAGAWCQVVRTPDGMKPQPAFSDSDHCGNASRYRQHRYRQWVCRGK